MRFVRRRTGLATYVVVLAAGGLCAGLIGTTPSLAAAASAPSALSAPSITSAGSFWAPLQVGGRLSASQAVTVAKKFHIIVAPAARLAPYVKQMRSANPSIVLLAYVNGTYQSSPTAFPSSMYLKDARGRRVQSRGYHLFLMDFTNPAWVSNRVQTCMGAIKSAHLDGCHMDVLGTGSLNPGYTTGLPINPHTHRVFTAAEWLHATDALAARVQNAAGSARTIIGNGLGDGVRFFKVGPSSILLGGEAGGVAEDWLHSAPDALDHWPSVDTWKLNVDMLGSASKGKIIVTITKTWARGTAALIAQWHEFSLASFLLGTSGRDGYSFFPSRGSSAIAPDPWDGFPLGAPTGNYTADGNGFVRNFTTGKVLVNPSGSRWTVNLGRTYRDVGGRRMTSATLAPHTGLILTTQ
jgi:hypothetical protein